MALPPDALIPTALLFAWWAATTGRWRAFWVAVVLALSCKEDAALAVTVLGLLVAWRWSRRTGLVVVALAATWFVLAIKVIVPSANGGLAPLYSALFPGYGDSLFEIAWNIVTHPGQVIQQAASGGPDGPRTYYWQLLAPVAFLPVAALPVFLIGGPQLLLNVVSGHPPTHDIRYHYSAIVIAAVFLATVEAVRRWPSPLARRLVVGVVLVASMITHVVWSPSPLGRDFNSGIWVRRPSARHASLEHALSLVPPDAPVSAVFYVVPHLTQRVHVYEWPNPFIPANWGVPGSDPPDPNDVQWLVLDRDHLGTLQPVFDQLTSTSFTVVLDRDGIVVARRR